MRVLSRANSRLDKLADLKGKIVARRRSRRTRQELLLDPARQAGHRSQQGRRLARLSRQSAAARGREGRGPGVPGFRSDRLSLAEGHRLQGSRLQSRRRIQGQDLLHPRPARQPGARGAAGGARADAGAARCGDVHRAKSGQGRGLVPALRAQDREPAGSAGDGALPHPSSPSRRRRAEARAEGLCRRSEDASRSSSRAPIRPNSRSGSMSTYSASKAVALAQSAEEGAALAGRPLSLRGLRFRRAGPACSQAWHGSASACHACGGRISATGRAPISSAIAAFVIAGAIFLATVAGSRLGRFNAGLQRRAPWLLALGAVPDPVGSRDREVRAGCRCRSSRRRSRSSRSTPTICRNCWTASLPR